MAQDIFKNAHISPTEIAAGDSDEFVITLVVGKGYTGGPSRIIYDLPATLGMSRPSLMHAEDNGFITTYVSNPDVVYSERNWDMEMVDFASRDKSSWRGMAQRLVILDLSPGLKEGDTIELHWGETGNGYGAGTKVTTVVPCPNYEAIIHVRYFEGHDDGLPDFGRSYEGYDRPEPACEIPLRFKIMPRGLHHLRLLRKVDGALLIPHDVFWNVPDVQDLAAIVDLPPQDTPAMPVRNAFHAFALKDKNVQVITRGVPLRDAPTMDAVFEGMNIYWGDVHTHSAFSIDCIEREKLERTPGDLMAFARQRAGLDFIAVTDHHLPWGDGRHRLGPDPWAQTMAAVQEHDAPGKFLVFAGIEYRCPRGDTAIVFNWLPNYAEIDQPTWTDIRGLWAGLDGRDYMSIPHFHNGGRLPEGEWWDCLSDGIEPVLEIFSCHGSYEREDVLEHRRTMIKRFRPDRNADYFLRHGYHYGLCANSDGHKGHVGSNGVTAVYGHSLTKEAILDAYRQRHVYGTTNARIRLLLTANGSLMGSILPLVERRTLAIDVAGENVLKKIELFHNGTRMQRFAPQGKTFQADLTHVDGQPGYYTVRVTQQDNHIAWSSPIWFE